MDRREDAFARLESGSTAIVPGNSAESELVRRITTPADHDDHMPPPKSRKKLSPHQITLLRDWVASGAPWRGHWSYLRPERPAIATVKNRAWPRNAIDYFILARLEGEGLRPSREADRIRLIRRLTFDLTGLPPTIAEIEDFVQDRRPDAYERLVDRLLALPQYGERMAMFWLDLARYADTNGYHIDNHRDLWKWREWVIEAFNRNLPFDQFTIQQLAGDLLPGATVEQRIASGFNRNEMVNFEGGADPDEYATKYVVGRVDTTAKVFLGTTLACAECHDHKYDPISQKEFYQFYAFFNNVAEKGLDGQQMSPAPRLQLPTPAEAAQLKQFNERITALESTLNRNRTDTRVDWVDQQQKWETSTHAAAVSNWNVLEPLMLKSTAGASLAAQPDHSLLATGENPSHDVYEITWEVPDHELHGVRLETVPHADLPQQGAGRDAEGAFTLTSIELVARQRGDETGAPAVFDPWHAVGPFPAPSFRKAYDQAFGPEKDTSLDQTYQDGKLKWEPRPEWKDGAPHPLSGDYSTTYLFRTVRSENPQLVPLDLGVESGGVQLWLNSRRLFANDSGRGTTGNFDQVRVRLARGENKIVVKVSSLATNTAFYFKPGTALGEYLVPFSAAIADYSQKDFGVGGAIDGKTNTGWAVGGSETNRHFALFVAQQPFGFPGGTRVTARLKFEGEKPQRTLGHFRLALSSDRALSEYAGLPENIRAQLLLEPGSRSTNQLTALRNYYRETFIPEVKQTVAELASTRAARERLDQSIVHTMVMQEMDKPRDTHVLVRGDFRNKGDKVMPNVPAIWGSLPPDPAPNRLALARWLVSGEHPLTSRVTVNRFWQNYFGNGLVKTANDFGSQGDWPSHPELLDWLATEFIDSGWDIKGLQKLIVMSATYRQDSRVTPALLEKDPYNRLLTRGPRNRLEAEAIRDNALALSGLLNRTVGGPSVKPYQPAGLWEAIGFFDNGNFSSQTYAPSKGTDLYRRGIYTYWKRSLSYPSFFTFDAPNREVCTVTRPRTTTPLQALVLLNDPVYVEAARVLGHRIMQEGGKKPKERLMFAFRLVLGRTPARPELEILERIYDQQRANFRADPAAARALIATGESPCPPEVDPGELAAWAAIGNVLLNLDETITKG